MAGDLPDVNWKTFPDNWSIEMKLDYQQKGYDIDSAATEANKGITDAQTAQEKADAAQSAADDANNKIDTQDNTFGQHVQNDSAHGAEGTVVGTEDYAQAALGGVVLLAPLVAPLVAITTTIASAPSGYDQTYAQEQTDAITAAISAINDTITKVNEVIAGQKSSGQMGIL